MTNFKLQQVSVGRVLTNFRVVDSAGARYGSINVPNEAAADLVAHWRTSDATVASKGEERNPLVKAFNARKPQGFVPASKQKSEASKIAAAIRKGPKLDKKAILRGS